MQPECLVFSLQGLNLPLRHHTPLLHQALQLSNLVLVLLYSLLCQFFRTDIFLARLIHAELMLKHANLLRHVRDLSVALSSRDMVLVNLSSSADALCLISIAESAQRLI